MTEDKSSQGSGGTDTQGGAESKESEKVVSRSAYDKAIDEIKALKAKGRDKDARLNEFEVQSQQIAENKLLEEKEFSTLIEKQRSEIERITLENQAHVKDKTDFVKMQSAMSVLQSKGVSLDQKYLGLLPIDQIQMNEDGQIDSGSVAEVVEGFQKEHPRLTMPASKLLPNNSTNSSGPKMSVSEWKKLGREEKREALAKGKVDHGHSF